jgi:methylmalonyl-CoA/ethylmalonyl-CoA epimerase
MSPVKKISHVAIVVDDIDSALHFWQDGLGMNVTHVEDLDDQKVLAAFLPAGDSEIELVKPTEEDTSVARFLKKYGPGMHHICLEVDDLTTSLDHLSTQGVRLINEEPIIGAGGKLVAFVHPESTHGVLIELYEPTKQESRIRLSRARKLADRAIAEGQVATAAALAFLRTLRGPQNDDETED